MSVLIEAHSKDNAFLSFYIKTEETVLTPN